MTVGERIRNRRKELGLTQEELGKKLGYGKSAVCRVEKEGNNITTDRITKFANALDCSPSYLMGWTSTPYQKQLNLYDLTDDKDTADHIRNNEFEVRYTLEHKRERAEITKEEYVVLESYRSLSEHEKEMVKRMIAYTDKFNELFKKEGDSK